MTTQEILSLEKLNATSIHFILEGTFWHVYERSAFLSERMEEIARQVNGWQLKGFKIQKFKVTLNS